MADTSNSPILYSVIIASLSSLAFGMNLTSYVSLEKIFRENNGGYNFSFVMTENQWALSQSILNIGALSGNLVIVFVNVNKKRLIIYNNILFLIGYTSYLMSNNVYFPIFGRFIIGMGLGIISNVTPSYLSSIASKENKGLISTCHQLFVMIGLLCGNIISYSCSEINLWKLSIIVQICFIIFQMISSLFILNCPVEQKHSKSLKELLTNKFATKSLILGLVLHIGQQLTGINGIIFTSDKILSSYGNPKLYSMLIGVAAICGVGVSMAVIDNFGRKLLLLISNFGVIFSLIVVGFDLYKIQSLFAMLISFAIGVGPIPWFIVNEIFETDYVSPANMICISANWIFSFVVTQTIGFFIRNFGSKVFIGYGLCTLLVFFVVLVFFKETKGKDPEFQ